MTIITTDTHEARYHELLAAGDARLPSGVRFEFVAEPGLEDAAGWYGQLHLWSARAYEALVRLYPDGGPHLVEFPDYLGEGCVTAQAKQTLDRRLRNTLVCIRAYTTAEMCAVLDGHLPDDRETRHGSEIERFALRHADCFLWPGGGVLDAYRAFYGEAGVCAPVEIPHTVAAGPDPTPLPDGPGHPAVPLRRQARAPQRGAEPDPRGNLASRRQLELDPGRRRHANRAAGALDARSARAHDRRRSPDQTALENASRRCSGALRRCPHLCLAVAVGMLAEHRARGVRAEPARVGDARRRAPGHDRARSQRLAHRGHRAPTRSLSGCRASSRGARRSTNPNAAAGLARPSKR